MEANFVSSAFASGLRKWLCSLLICSVAIWLAPVHAEVIKGTFTGIAYNSRINGQSPDHSNFDGETVTGSFTFDPYSQTPEEPPIFDGTVYYQDMRPFSTELVFNAHGQKVSFINEYWWEGDLSYSFKDPQFLDLSPGAFPQNWFAQLKLVGPLFDGSLESVHAASVDLDSSFAYFFAGKSFGASLKLTNVTFEAAPVPEPSALALILAGFLAASATSVFRRRERL